MNPQIIMKETLTISGIMGDGNKTALLWDEFEKKSAEIENKTDENGYEIRFYYDDKCDCFVGHSVSNAAKLNASETLSLPASEYAVFDVVVANGYDSENETIDNWLKNNSEKYIERKLTNKSYVVECYSEKFENGIVEIWIPICKKQ